MRRYMFTAVALAGLAIVVHGCSTELPMAPLDSLSAFTVSDVNGSALSCADLIADEEVVAGTVCFGVVGDVLEVTYSMVDDWELKKADLWIGCTPGDYPQDKRSSPRPNKFPYRFKGEDGVTTHTFHIPLSDLPCMDAIVCDPGNILYVMAHAKVRRPGVDEDDPEGWGHTDDDYYADSGGEDPDDGLSWNKATAWADGDPTSGSDWATEVVITLQDDSCTDVSRCFETRTAYAFGERDDAFCFLFLDLDNDGQGDFFRWGWTNLISPGYYVWDLYANAVGCNRANGAIVGTITVDYDGSTAVITYDLDPANGWTLARTSVYAGAGILPINPSGIPAASPLAYPFQADHALCEPGTTPRICDGPGQKTFSVTETGLSGDIHVIAHAALLREIECP